MPKERLNISRFDGVAGIADAKDLPDGLAYYAENIDIVTRDGVFVGAPYDETYTDTDGLVGSAASHFQTFLDGTVAALKTGTTLSSVTIDDTAKNFQDHATPVNTTVANVTPAMASEGEAVHVGFGPSTGATYKPKWVGYIYHTNFGASLPSPNDPQICDAELESKAFGWRHYDTENSEDTITLTFPASTDGSTDFLTTNVYDNSQVTFKVGTTYTWYASAIFNGTEQAPLKRLLKLNIRADGITATNRNGDEAVLGASGAAGDAIGVVIEGGTKVPATFLADYKEAIGLEAADAAVAAEGFKSITFKIGIDTSALNGRVSGVKIYRSELDPAGNELPPVKVKYFQLDNSADALGEANDEDEYTWIAEAKGYSQSDWFATGGNYYWIPFTDEGGGVYEFEQETGYNQSIRDMGMYWGLSCVVGGHHIIGDCYTNALLDTNAYLFKSKPYQYSTFDWSKDFLVLPEKPVALVAHRGKVFAFSTGKVFVIDPYIWDIEQEWDSAGTFSPQSVVSCEAGLYWASPNGIYQFDSALMTNVGRPILRLEKPIENNTGKLPTQIGWLDRNAAKNPVMGYDSTLDAIVVFYAVESLDASPYNVYMGLMMHVPTQRWVPISSFATSAATINEEPIQCFNNKDGRLIFTTSSGSVIRMFTGSDRRPWRFVSRQLGEQAEAHTYYHAYVGNDESGLAPKVSYYTNDPSYNSPIQAQTSELIHDRLRKYELTTEAGVWERSRDFAIEVSAAKNVDCTDFTLVRRRVTAR